MHLVTQTYSFFKQIQSAGLRKQNKLKEERCGRNLTLLWTLFIVQCLLLESTHILFYSFQYAKKVFQKRLEVGYIVYHHQKIKNLVIIQNMGLSVTGVHELDEKADSCLIWPAWVSCKSVPHWMPKKDMLFYLSAQQCDLHTTQASTAETGTFNNKKKGHWLVSSWSPLRTTRIRKQVSVIGNITEYCTYISNRWSDF